MFSNLYQNVNKKYTIFLYKERSCCVCKKKFRYISNNSHACENNKPCIEKKFKLLSCKKN